MINSIMNRHGHKRSYDEFSGKYSHVVEIKIELDAFDPKNPKRLAKKRIRAKMNDILKVNFEDMNIYIYTQSSHFEECSSFLQCSHSSYYAKDIVFDLTANKNNIDLICVTKL